MNSQAISYLLFLLLAYLISSPLSCHSLPTWTRSNMRSPMITFPLDRDVSNTTRPCPGSPQDAIQLPRDLGVHPDYDTDYFYWTGTIYAPECTTANISASSQDSSRVSCLYHYSIIFGQITALKLAIMWIQMNSDPDNIVIRTRYATPFYVQTQTSPEWTAVAYDYLSNPPQYDFQWTTINNTVDVGSVGAEYHMSLTTPSYALDLTFVQQEPYFGYGDNGYVNLENKTCTGSYYFALPGLQQTAGKMTWITTNDNGTTSSTTFATLGQGYFERQYRIMSSGQNETHEAHWDWLYASIGDYQYGLMCAVPANSFCTVTICSISGRTPCQNNIPAHVSYITSHTMHGRDVPIKSYIHIETTPSQRLLMEPRFINMDDYDLYDQYMTVTHLETQQIGTGWAEYIRWIVQ